MKQNIIQRFVTFILGIFSILSPTYLIRKMQEYNQELFDREEKLYKAELEKFPSGALAHWNHANRLASLSVRAAVNAWQYYQKATIAEPQNAAIYKDFGKYLAVQMHAFDEARSVLSTGYQISAKDPEIKDYLDLVDNVIQRRDEALSLKAFGNTSIRELNPEGDYAAITNFQLLKNRTTDINDRFFYSAQLKRFMNDDKKLTPEEMYMLLIGYAHSSDYKPYNYSGIESLQRMNAEGKTDMAFAIADELLETNPLNPSINQELMYSFRKTGDMETAERYSDRIRQVFNGMLFSGNGSTERSYVTLWVKEEYNFARYLGFKPTGNCTTSRWEDRLTDNLEVLARHTGKIEIIHYNISLIFKAAIGIYPRD